MILLLEGKGPPGRKTNEFLFIAMSKRPFGVQIVFPNKNNPLDVCDVLRGNFLPIMSFELSEPHKEGRISHSPSVTSPPL